MKPLSVWGTNLVDYRFGKTQVRAIVAAKSRAAAGRCFQLTDSYMRDFACETGNAREIETAMKSPGTVFVAPLDGPERQNFVRK